jgi:hypothetical protein
MNAILRNILTSITICALLATTTTEPAMASRPRPADSLPTRSDIVWIGVAIAAIGAAIGIGIYFAVRQHGHSITGCAASGTNGLQLVSENDRQMYALSGEIAGIKSGDRIRVSGKKQKKDANVPPQFLVEKVNKDFGSCPAASGAP